VTTVQPLDDVEDLTRRSWLPAALRTSPNIGVYLGLAVVIAGGGLLLLAWGRVAGVTDVALQTPYVISAGCLGLAFVAIGLAIISIAAKVADGRARAAQLTELQETMAAIRVALEEQR
jgi:hypothetical protein